METNPKPSYRNPNANAKSIAVPIENSVRLSWQGLTIESRDRLDQLLADLETVVGQLPYNTRSHEALLKTHISRQSCHSARFEWRTKGIADQINSQRT